ncbi:MAG: hypothetical protein Q4D20_02855 [Clostridia bacterium]|nr:hypothetical protein [Clostridia bacterium]
MPVFVTKTIKQPKNIITDYIELDKAGIIYPYVATNDWNSVYRVEAKLSKPLDFNALKTATETMRKNYPYFFMTLAKKDKRFVLSKAESDKVLVENIYPVCRPFDLESKKPLVRIIYDENTIAVELFHVLADGHGGERFFKALLENYRKNLNHLSIASESGKEENEFNYDLSDIYEEFSKEGGKNVSRFMTKAFQFKKQDEAPLSARCIDVSLGDLKAAAKRKGVSITMFVCALQIATIFETEKTKNKTVRISVPVDIRRFAGRDTSRNGALYILVGVKRSDVKNFDDILESVKAQFEKYLTKENMLNMSYSNISTSKLKAFEMLPLSVKKFVLNIGYTLFGEDQFTSTLTNTGVLEFGKEFDDIIEDAYFVLGKQKTKPINIAMSTFKNSAKLMVSTVYKDEKFTKKLTDLLDSYGVPTVNKKAGKKNVTFDEKKLAS